MMRFAYPWLLMLYLPWAAMIIYVMFFQRRPGIIVPSEAPFRSAVTKKRFALSIPEIIHFIALAALILAFARPQRGIEELKQRAEGIDIMLALDLSGSMRAIDIPEEINSSEEIRDAIRQGKLVTRLDVAKEEIARFVEKRPNDRIGLIAFASQPYVACPPTLDHAWLYRHLDTLEAGIIGDATGIAGPIASAVSRLKDADSKRKVLVLFTDGKNNVQARLSPRQAAKLAKTYDVIIYTVGIGSRRALIVQETIFGRSRLAPFEDEFDEPLLEDIAEESDGKYYSAADAQGLRKVMSEIDKLEKTSAEQPRYVDYQELAPKIIIAAIALIIGALILNSTLCFKLP